MANRVDHFAALRGSQEEVRAPDPALEYEKYRITPKLLEVLKDLSLTVRAVDPLRSGLDDLLQANAARAYRKGQDDIIMLLGRMMADQENQ